MNLILIHRINSCMSSFYQKITKKRLIQKLLDLIWIFFHQTISTIGRHLQKKLEPNPRPSPKILIFRQGIWLKIFFGSKIFFSNSEILSLKIIIWDVECRKSKELVDFRPQISSQNI